MMHQIFFVRVKDLCAILYGCTSEEVYDRHLASLCV